VRVIPCGIDYTAFHSMPDKQGARSELGIAEGARVVGHIGRLHPSKNHPFLLDAFANAARVDPKLHLLLVGDGESRRELEMRAEELGLRRRVTFVGVRSDIPRMLAAMDVFAFPSIYEGFGLVLVEAQAAGLPIVVSNTVPIDALIASHWTRRLSLADCSAWSSAFLEAADLPRAERKPSLNPRFDIGANLEELLSVYGSKPLLPNPKSTELYGAQLADRVRRA
jgi:glycosyltransferase involved in cell wall biosynthesis